MRFLASVGLAILITCVATVPAQEPDELDSLIGTNRQAPMSLSVENGRLSEILDAMGRIGQFEVYVTDEIAQWPPVSFEYQHRPLDTVIREVLATPGLTYRVVEGRTLLVSRS